MRYFLPIIPLIAGFILDALIGDPYTLPHPIRAIGTFIAKLENTVRSRFDDLKKGGVFLALTVISVSALIPAALLFACYKLNTALGIIAESVLCCYMLAARNLRDESMKVCNAADLTLPYFFISSSKAAQHLFRKSAGDPPFGKGSVPPLSIQL